MVGWRAETEWDDTSRAEMYALAEYEAGLCPGCRGHLDETTDPDAIYDADLPVRCHRCTRLAIDIEKYRDSPQPHALHHRVHLRGE